MAGCGLADGSPGLPETPGLTSPTGWLGRDVANGGPELPEPKTMRPIAPAKATIDMTSSAAHFRRLGVVGGSSGVATAGTREPTGEDSGIYRYETTAPRRAPIRRQRHRWCVEAPLRSWGYALLCYYVRSRDDGRQSEAAP